MFILWTFFLSCGPTENESKVQKKHFIHGFWTFSFWQCKGRPTRYELGSATWDLTCDMGGGTWVLPLRTCDLTLATCKHLWEWASGLNFPSIITAYVTAGIFHVASFPVVFTPQEKWRKCLKVDEEDYGRMMCRRTWTFLCNQWSW